ncbi:MAG: GH92 family glycosyl hydrolase [Ignavibacteriales bacterium]|nr:GH92 family glycosyl hydrolase [Ignavibacteriales bacterium]
MRYFLSVILSLGLVVSGTYADKQKSHEKKNAVEYVNTFIGTADANVKLKNLAYNFGGGNTYPGAVTPWGMTAISPRNTIESPNEGDFAGSPSGYISGKEFIYGFSQIHLSGVGCNEWGNILVMPTVGPMSADINVNRSKYEKEEASPGYYKVLLKDFNILTEVTATTHSTMSKYTCLKPTEEFNVVFDLFHAIRAANDGYIKIESDSEIVGWNQNGGFCGNKAQRKVYFVARFDKPAVVCNTIKDGTIIDHASEQSGARIGGILRFSMKQDESLCLKIGISFVSIENAKLNLITEQPNWDFNQVKHNARKLWENVLSRITVEDSNEDAKVMFYTALYHALIHPSICSDVNGEYIAMGSRRVKKISGKQQHQYNVYSLWDTYRNLHQLLTLVYPEVQIDMVRTMVDQAHESGFLPKWELSADETYVMVGDPACMVIADTYIKGLKDFDVQGAYRAMLKSSLQLKNNKVRPGLDQYLKLGYIPQDKMGEGIWGTVATSLEYYVADFAIAQLAKSLGKIKEFEVYGKRALGYKNFFDPKTTFLRAKNEDGTWCEPFDPDTIKGSIPGANFPCGGIGYTEGNAWQYNFFVPHDINGLIELMGREPFIKKLQACFDKPDRFVLFNEPDMAYPYLFSYVKGSEYLTQAMARKCIDYYFANNSGGLPGNDDCGTTSAWFIFSALGFYPACPASTDYRIGSPIFDKVTIQLNPDYYTGKQFVIETRNNSKSNIYIRQMKLNGKDFSCYSLDHNDIVQGGEWNVTLGDLPMK